MKIFTLLLAERKITICEMAVLILLCFLLPATTVLGDEIENSLPPETPPAVIASVQQAVQKGLQQESVVKLTRTMLHNKFNQKQIQRAHSLMIDSNNSGMAIQPLMNKAFEGIAKGVDPSLIVGAMEKVQSRNAFAYKRAARISKNKSQTANLGKSLSAGLAAGLSKDDADKITNMIEQRSRSMKSENAYSLALECFNTARDMSRLSVSSGTITGMVSSALNKGYNHDDMRAMRSAYIDEARHSDPQKLAHSYSEAIQEGRGFDKGSGEGGRMGSGGQGSGVSGPGSGGSGGSGGGGGPGSGGGGSGGSGPGGGGSGGHR
jgi:hypothetical protein